MQSKLLKIKMMPSSRTHLAKLIGFIEQNIAPSEYEMRQKGYY
ncbi:hypothetical protein [Shewanella sp. KX20019]|nr:hypothetical protein [Shewanella sp. KX20019]